MLQLPVQQPLRTHVTILRLPHRSDGELSRDFTHLDASAARNHAVLFKCDSAAEISTFDLSRKRPCLLWLPVGNHQWLCLIER